MKCRKCQFDNDNNAKFCSNCGANLELVCPACGHTVKGDSVFCEQCGHRLRGRAKGDLSLEGERRYVTVLLSDLSGYTGISENLDPEVLKELTSQIFRKIVKIVTSYEGFIEKFVGDAVMALFGVPTAHEDDPIRAIKTAQEIHEAVEALSPEVEKRAGYPISMHTGINTGVVVTGEIDIEKGTHGVAGDTINVASRLCSIAKKGEILVGPYTYKQSEGLFAFKEIGPTRLKGRAKPVQIYKVLYARKKPLTIHRLSGLRAAFVGRKRELGLLREALNRLYAGKGTIFSICGEAGTGKSRLIEEFRASCDLKKIQWLEGHAYAWAQNIPYFPMRDLFYRAFEIEKSDSPREVKEKIETEIKGLVGGREDAIYYIGSLCALEYPEMEGISPELWKSGLREAAKTVISALAIRAPTVIVFEDLHWADFSFVELLRHLLIGIRQPAVVLCVHRPTFRLFQHPLPSNIHKICRKIEIQDLSPSEARAMLASLLRSRDIPADLWQFVQKRTGGNPFYIEELVNSLVESDTLIFHGGGWKISKPVADLEISPTLYGLVFGRLDRLEEQMKRLLQEAAVIGRTFSYEILRMVTGAKDRCEELVSGLEQLDLIRKRSHDRGQEYIFKHAFTQEVAYKSLLVRERELLHEKTARAIEKLFQERISEAYETLAFHFKKSRASYKAVYYLSKSGEKSLRRYAVEESHQYYKEAYTILVGKGEITEKSTEILIDLFIKWAHVFYYRGDFKGLTELLLSHIHEAQQLDDRSKTGMYYCWLGMGLWARERFRESYEYLLKALELGDQINDLEVVGYACTWLVWTCGELGLLGEAVSFGKRAQAISKVLVGDPYLFLALWEHWVMFTGIEEKLTKYMKLPRYFLTMGIRIEV